MKSVLHRIAALTAAATTLSVSAFSALPAIASSPFGQQDVDQNKFVAVASPIGGGSSHQQPTGWPASGVRLFRRLRHGRGHDAALGRRDR